MKINHLVRSPVGPPKPHVMQSNKQPVLRPSGVSDRPVAVIRVSLIGVCFAAEAEVVARFLSWKVRSLQHLLAVRALEGRRRFRVWAHTSVAR